MTRMDNLKIIKKILKDTFCKSKIPKDISNLKLGDLKEWDSLGNFNFLLAVENIFKVKFDFDEISKIQSIKSLLAALKKRKIANE